MKIDCQIIQDLYPLYLDGVCSDASRTAVEQHLQECPHCRKLYSAEQPLPNLRVSADLPNQETVAKRSFKKIRRRWIASLLAVLMLLPLGFLGYMGYNEYHGSGICFSNLDDLWTCHRFMDALESGDYDEAAQQLALTNLYQEYQEVLAMTPEDHMPSYVTITIDGQKWFAAEWFALSFPFYEEDAWEYLIRNGVFGALIPENVWLRSYPQISDGGSYRVDNTYFYRHETQWGNFYVPEEMWDSLYMAADDPATLSELIYMFPEDMFRDLQPLFRQRAERIVANLQERFGGAANLSEAQYYAHVRKQYAEQLEAMENNGIRFESLGYRDAQSGEEWIISYSVRVIGNGESVTFFLDFYMEDGKIRSLVVSYGGPPSSLFSAAIDALRPSIY